MRAKLSADLHREQFCLSRLRLVLPSEARINSFAGKRFYYAGGVADEKNIFVSARNGRTSKRRYGAPGLIRRDLKMALRPLPQFGNGGRRAEIGRAHV